MTAAIPLLEVDNLRVAFDTADGLQEVVKDLSFTVNAGQTLGLIGESGCGKTVTALSVLRLLPKGGRAGGAIRFRGIELLGLPERGMRVIRGSRIAMVFQDSMTSLNPVMTIGSQLSEAMRTHQRYQSEPMKRTLDLLHLVNLPDADLRVTEYPHQLSGGMRQRVMIAMALACDPDVLIADEPTSALDAVTQSEILDEVDRLQLRLGMGILLVTHDFGVVARACDRVVVLYGGRKVEEASVDELLDSPLHPYTRALLDATPSVNARRARLDNVPDIVSPAANGRVGCSFAPRCAYADAKCRAAVPPLKRHASANTDSKREVACFAVEDHRIWATRRGSS